MSWQEQVDQIVADAQLGATPRTVAVAKAIIALTSTGRFENTDTLLEAIARLCTRVFRSQMGMASLISMTSRILFATGARTTPDEAAIAARDHANAYLKETEQVTKDLARRGVALMATGLTLSTFSASSTILETLLLAHRSGRNPTVICHESRPSLEGRMLAKDLAAAGVKVILSADSGMYSSVHQSEMVLVGADALLEDGIIARQGTATLAACAKWLGVPCYVLADSDKIWSFELGPQPLQQRDPTEVWSDAPAGVTISSPLYDVTSWDAVSAVITEKGLLSAKEVRQLSRERPVHPLALKLVQDVRAAL